MKQSLHCNYSSNEQRAWLTEQIAITPFIASNQLDRIDWEETKNGCEISHQTIIESLILTLWKWASRAPLTPAFDAHDVGKRDGVRACQIDLIRRRVIELRLERCAPLLPHKSRRRRASLGPSAPPSNKCNLSHKYQRNIRNTRSQLQFDFHATFFIKTWNSFPYDCF